MESKKISTITRAYFKSIKNGGFFKTMHDARPYIIGFAKETVIDGHGRNWHLIMAAFFYNYRTGRFFINSTCGCSPESYAIKPNADDLILLKKKLEEKKVKFNRKKKEICYET